MHYGTRQNVAGESLSEMVAPGTLLWYCCPLDIGRSCSRMSQESISSQSLAAEPAKALSPPPAGHALIPRTGLHVQLIKPRFHCGLDRIGSK